MQYGLIGKITATPGRRDELVAILLKATELLQKNPDCIHYLVGTGKEADCVWVIETWTTKAAHDASLEPADIKALIQQAIPIIAAMPEQTELQMAGGKGL